MHPELLRELPHVTMTSFLVIFARSWQSRKFPEGLKTAKVTLFLKTGKKEALGSSKLVNLASTRQSGRLLKKQTWRISKC